MDQELRELKSSLDELPRRGRRGRRAFSKEMQAAVLELIDRGLAEGRSIHGMGKALGIAQTTLASWGAGDRSKNGEQRLRRVRVLERATPPPSAQAQLVLVTPHGYRVEGLTSEQLVQVLQVLR